MLPPPTSRGRGKESKGERIKLTTHQKPFWANVPKHEVEALARSLLPAIQAYFESEEGQREFAEWEAQQER